MSPKPFDDCIKNGGKVRTKSLGGNKYMHICILNGKSYGGEVKTKEAGNPGRAIMKEHEKRMGKKGR